MLDLYRNIKNERIKKGWTQTELALKVGYSDKSMIAKIEAGKVDLPQTKIRMFAEAFNCTESHLMGYDGVSIFEPLDLSSVIKRHEIESSLTDDEIDYIEIFRSLDEESKRQLVLMLAFLKDQQNKK